MPVVAADPYPVDQPLVIRVDGDHVLTGAQIRQNIDGVVSVRRRIAGRRSLSDKDAVYVELVVVVRGDSQYGVLRQRGKGEMLAKENVRVRERIRGQIDRLQLPVKDVARYP